MVDIADVMYLINYLFIDGSAPDPFEAGDANYDGEVDIADVMYLINYLFIGGSQPCAGKQGALAKVNPASAEVSLGVSKMDEAGATISIEGEFDVDVAGIQLAIKWDQSKLELSDVSLTSRTQKLGLYHNDGKGGELKIGLVDLSGKESVSAGKAALLRLNMKSSVDALDVGSIKIEQAILVDKDAGKLAVKIVDKLGEANIPKEFSLSQNYPNPFNPQTIIQYGLPYDCDVEIAIYNILGQKIKTLVNEHQQAGRRRKAWDGRNENGEEVSSGIYFYRIKAGEFVQTKKMAVLK